jgi:hypothetical protein|tara:strand:- start:8 stop:679 length:672 start_codon:yes stop_codon:yes gene_type:complete
MSLKIKIPSDLSEIKLSQYKKYMQIVDTNKDDLQDKETFFSLKILEIFCNIPYKTAMKIAVNDVSRIVNKISTVLNKEQELVRTFKMGDTEFGFIPKLDDMTFGEYIDLDNNISDWQKMEKAMAVLYRPITKQQNKLYDIEEYRGDSYHDIMNNMPLDAVFGSLVFFYHLGIELSKTMVNFLTTEEVKMDSTLERILIKNGAGITQFTHSLKEMLDELKISHN